MVFYICDFLAISYSRSQDGKRDRFPEGRGRPGCGRWSGDTLTLVIASLKFSFMKSFPSIPLCPTHFVVPVRALCMWWPPCISAAVRAAHGSPEYGGLQFSAYAGGRNYRQVFLTWL